MYSRSPQHKMTTKFRTMTISFFSFFFFFTYLTFMKSRESCGKLLEVSASRTAWRNCRSHVVGKPHTFTWIRSQTWSNIRFTDTTGQHVFTARKETKQRILFCVINKRIARFLFCGVNVIYIVFLFFCCFF